MEEEEIEVDSSDVQLDYQITGEYAHKILRSYKLQSDDIYRAVRIYDDAQRLRMAYKAKSRTQGNELTEWFDSWLGVGEHTIKPILTRWVSSPDAPAEAQWAYQQIGVGPIIAAALSGYIDVTRAVSASSVWKLSGLAHGFDRKTKGQKIPYNENLKVVAWKAGESFVKVMSKPDSFYGRLFVHYKDQEERDNAEGKHAASAARELDTKRITDPETRATLESGKLTQGHLHSRAKRKTVKEFLVSYWQVGRKARGLDARPIYAASVLGHDGIRFPDGPPDDQPVPVSEDLLRRTDIILARWQVRKAQGVLDDLNLQSAEEFKASEVKKAVKILDRLEKKPVAKVTAEQVEQARVILDDLKLRPAEEFKAEEVANAEEILEQAKESLFAAQKRAK